MRPALLTSLLGNPVFVRHLATTFTGPRLGLAFLVLCGAMVVLYGALFAVQTFEAVPPAVVFVAHNTVLLGVLIVLLPLKVTGLIEGPRLARAFDQIVVTGASPGLLYRGAWFAGFCYAAVLLFVTVPFAACMVVFGGVEPWRMLLGYGTLLLYCNVILAAALAASAFAREWLATPLAVAALGGTALLSLHPAQQLQRVFHPVFAELAPIRLWVRQAGGPDLHAGILAADPVLVLWQVPVEWLWPVLWLLVCVAGALLCAVGPGHVFAPGFDNFGAVVLRGDRRRGFVGLLRGAQTRRVEMGFFYENAAEWTKRWGAPIRTALVVLFVVLVWAALLGTIHGAAPQPQGNELFGDGRFLGGLLGGGTVLALWCFGQCAARTSADACLRFGPVRLSRETVAWLVFPVLLGVLLLAEWLPMQAAAASGAPVLTPADVPVWVAAWWRAAAAMLLAVTNLFLLSRIACRATDSEVRARLYCLLLFAVFLIVPSLLAGLVAVAEAPPSPLLEALAHLSPAVLTSRSGVAGWGAAAGFAKFAGAHLLLAVLLLAALAALCLAPRLRRAPLAAVALLCLGTGLGAQGPVEIVEVVRGFDGVVFDGLTDFYHLTLRNPGTSTVTAEYRVEDLESRVLARGSCVLGPRSARTEYLSTYRRANPVRIFVRAGGQTSASQDFDLDVVGGSTWNGQGSPRRAIEPFLFVGTRGSFPAELVARNQQGNPMATLLGCRGSSLPRSVRAYSGAAIVWIPADGLRQLRADQQRALYGYLRLGGSVIVHGRLGEAQLEGAGPFADLLRPVRQQDLVVDGRTLVSAELAEGRTLLAVPGAGSMPFLHARQVGAGTLAHVACAPDEGAFPQRLHAAGFCAELDAALPRGRLQIELHGRLSSSRGHDRATLVHLVLYYSTYCLGLAVALFALARRREHRRRLWLLVGVTPLAFLGGVPFLLAFIDGRPSTAELLEVEYFAAGSTRGIATGNLAVHSAGKQHHAVRIAGEDVESFAGERLPRLDLLRALTPMPRDGVALAMPRWTRTELSFYRSTTRAGPIEGSAVVLGQRVVAEARLPPAWRSRPVFLVLQDSGFQCRTVRVAPDAAGLVRATVDFAKVRQTVGIATPSQHFTIGIPGDESRVLLAIVPEDQRRVIESDDLVFGYEIPEAQARVRMAAMPQGHGVAVVGGRYFESGVRRLVLVELPVEGR